MSLSMCTVLGMVIGNGASDAAPQEPHDINWLHTRYDGGPIRREDIGDVFLSMEADGKTLTWQQAHQLAGVAHGIVQRHGNHRYAAGYRHGIDTGVREGRPGEPRCEILVGPFTSCGQQLLAGDDMCGEHRARSYVDIIERQQREIELLRAELNGSLIEKARGLLGHRVRVWPAFDTEKSGPPIWEGYVAGCSPAPTLSVVGDDDELQSWMVTLPIEDLGEVEDPAVADLDDEDLGDEDEDGDVVDPLTAFQAFADTVAAELDEERDEHIRGHLAAAVRADRRGAGPEVRTHVQRALNVGATWEQVADTFGIGTELARERFTPGVTE